MTFPIRSAIVACFVAELLMSFAAYSDDKPAAPPPVDMAACRALKPMADPVRPTHEAPDEEAMLMKNAVAAAVAGRTEEAAKLYTEAAQGDTSNYEAAQKAADNWIKLREFGHAARLLRAAGDDDTNPAEALKLRNLLAPLTANVRGEHTDRITAGETARAAGQYAKALESYAASEDSDPVDSAPYLKSAEIYADCGDKASTLAMLRFGRSQNAVLSFGIGDSLSISKLAKDPDFVAAIEQDFGPTAARFIVARTRGEDPRAALHPATPGEGDWKVYVYKDEGFAISFPAPPVVEDGIFVASHDFASGPAHAPAKIYSVIYPYATYRLTVADFRDQADNGANLLGQTVDWLDQSENVRIDMSMRIGNFRQSVFGRSLSIQHEDGSRSAIGLFFNHGKLFVSETRFYPGGDVDSPDSTRFGASLCFFQQC